MKRTILVVDDNPKVTGALKTYLEETFDCEVITAPDGFAAIKLLQEEKPSIEAVILDLFMKTHGGKVAHYLRDTPQYRAVLLIFYTGMAKHQIDKDLLNIGYFVSKTKDSLDEIVRLLSRRFSPKED